jgi:BCD family chlorophyll transporter-like MFS transporter
MDKGMSWFGIVRLGLVQTALGAIVVLTTSALNRVMVVELALPALIPGVLVALHHGIQITRPRWGYGSDMGGRRTPWILGGMAVLALGGIAAAAATAWMATDRTLGVLAAVLAFAVIGIGAGAAGTSLLALLASCVAERRRAAAATTVWLMMIAGFVVTTAVAGRLLDPYSPARLVAVATAVSAIAMTLALVAVWGVERRAAPTVAAAAAPSEAGKPDFRAVMAEVWEEPKARRFTVFVFVSMLAYSAQDLILEPFAGAVFGLSVGQTTKLSSAQHGGVLIGMILVAIAGSAFAGRRRSRDAGVTGPGGSPLLGWTIGGCIASAAAFVALAVGGHVGPGFPLGAAFFALGMANGAFAAAAIAMMMQLAGQGRAGREGTRMGLWGAAQAVAFGLGNIVGTGAADLARWTTTSDAAAYGAVFAAEAALFLASAVLAARVGRGAEAPKALGVATARRQLPAEG